MEKEFKVEPYEVIYTCDNCGRGELEYTGLRRSSVPATYENQCPNCKNSFYLKYKYPTIRYKRVEVEG